MKSTSVHTLIIGMGYFGNELHHIKIENNGLLAWLQKCSTSNGVDLQRNNHDTMRAIRCMQSKTQMPKLSKQGEIMNWKPIETAPKDSSWVLLKGGEIDYGWEGYDQPPCVVGQYTNQKNGRLSRDHWQYAWYDGGYYGEYENPTHWMELPKEKS